MDAQGGDKAAKRACVLGIGNELLLDEGAGPAVARALLSGYEFPGNIDVLERGVMGMALIAEFEQYSYIVSVDAVDGTGQPAGTVFAFKPEDLAENNGFKGAHDVRFIDVIQAAALLGHQVVGDCVGIQVDNMSPSEMVIGLTPAVEAAIPLACQTALALLWSHGYRGIVDKSTGVMVEPPQ